VLSRLGGCEQLLRWIGIIYVSILKIDRAFISKISDLEHEQHIVNAIIMMSKSLGIQNVAEGIEDAETAQWLRDAGCQIGQGYLWAKPLPLDEFIEYLQNENQQE
jgi:EAL domain-containing protein (putative c-di-GMP-specific phosphodiesterase class I)